MSGAAMATPYPGTDSDSDPRGTPSPRPSPLPSPGRPHSALTPSPTPSQTPGSGLAALERDLAMCISDLLAMKEGGFHSEDSDRRLAEVNKNLAYLRGKMRQLRRWRSGVERGSKEHEAEMIQLVGKSQFLVFESRVSQMEDQVSEINISVQELGLTDESDVCQLQGEVGCLLPVLKERLRSVDTEKDETVACLPGFREDLTEIHNTITGLRSRLSRSKEKSKRRSAPPLMLTSITASPAKIEDHPLVNPLLRMRSRIRRLLGLFLHGYHEPSEGSIPCVDNDIDVLSRQIEKVSRWCQCEKQFARADLENMELIVSAMERHLRPAADMCKSFSCELPTECVNRTCKSHLAIDESEDSSTKEMAGIISNSTSDNSPDKGNHDIGNIDLNFNQDVSLNTTSESVESLLDERLI